LSARRPSLLDQLRDVLRTGARDSVDWEAVTGSQYARRQAPMPGQPGNTTAA
jgi:hypothetical protein